MIVEAADADHLLAVRDALKALTTGWGQQGQDRQRKGIVGATIKEADHEASPHHHAACRGEASASANASRLKQSTALLWPLQPDDRMTVLINLMAAQINRMVENEDQIDALIDVLRMQLKLSLPHAAQEDQHRV